MESTKTHQQNLQTAKDFMATLAKGEMDKLMNFWADDGVLEFPFHPPGARDRVEGKSNITEYFSGTEGRKKPLAFPITGSYPMLDPQMVLIEFEGKLQNLVTGEHYTNKYVVLFQFNEAGEVILFREYFDSLKRQKYETHD
ncbi:nuclear transport factor 2 family protein [Lusitaniella coriacea]|uniref:nuclear transport factor 2 family protein n=1 Tax=Lusitaniella coriacea TaxID=1983105 RepID=UPI003CE70E75